MKKNIFLASSLFVSAALSAQTINYAINSEGNGGITTPVITQLDNATEATFQLWMNPKEWVSGAVLMGQDNLSLECGADQTLILRSGTFAVKAENKIPLGEWTQVTVTVSADQVDFYFDGALCRVSGEIPAILPATGDTSFDICKNFIGQLDEIRIWKKALPKESFYENNTLNKYHSEYENLIAYWKCDQDQCENLVDYQFRYHGVFDRINRIEVSDNTKFKYRIVSGYVPSLMRFIDRPNIDREMFLMTNDAILLSGKVQADGSLFPEYPDNSAHPINVDQLGSFKGRDGVFSFTGAGSKMVASDGRAPFDPTSSLGYGVANMASFGAWVYIEKWEEGGRIFSKWQDEDNCMVIRLGNEAAQEVIVDFCGTVATLPGKLETGKWQYLGVYFKPMVGELTGRTFNPISISVDYTVYSKLGVNNAVKLSGKNMTISTVPQLPDTPIEIGDGFNGKMDEIMVWGSDRSSNAQNDAEKGYQWNVGSWGNIFLNAYWKGDDNLHIGKDYQSYTHMIEYIRNYYAGHRGMKVRIGLIYPNGEGWKNVLDKTENADRFIADAKELLKHCDGLDVDLEWHNYHVFNPIAHRLVNEVMAGHREDKIFTISQHEYSYQLDKALIPHVDYFTMQMYGPQPFSYDYGWYEAAYQKFIDYGYPKDKLLLSYGVLLVNNGEEGYKDLYEKYGYNDDNFNPDLNQWNCNGTVKYFNGINQTKKKQQFVIDNDCLGTMYFDMANDVKVSDYKSLIRAQNEIIASNVDTLITRVDMDPSAITPNKIRKEPYAFYPNPAKEFITLSLSPEAVGGNAVCRIYTLEGVAVRNATLEQESTVIRLNGLAKGIYVLEVVTNSQTWTSKLKID